jgi:hypothetical protein
MYKILIVNEKLQIRLLCEYLRALLTNNLLRKIQKVVSSSFFLVLTSVYLLIPGEDVTVASDHTHTRARAHARTHSVRLLLNRERPIAETSS